MISKANTFKKLSSLLHSDSSRTRLAIKNVIGSLFVKGGSVLVSLLVVPLTINYVNADQYGIWLALSSIIAWLSFFDIGLGNGLKNKLTMALANGDSKLAKSYISTTYALLAILAAIFLLVFLLVHQFISWSSVLSLPPTMEQELGRLISIVIIFFSLQFVFQTIVVILTAHQQVSVASLLGFLGNLVSMAIIWILIKTTEGSLFYLGLAFSVAPLVVYLVASFYYFNADYKTIAPSFKAVDFKFSRELMGLGVKFFIIQIAAIVLYQTTNIMLVKMYGPAEVTSYNISYKYFSVISMVFSIVMSPFWVAFSDAFFKKDIQWIQNTVRKLIRIWLAMSVLGIIMWLVSIPVIRYWVGPTVEYKWENGLAMLLYFISFSFGSIFVFFINGTGKVYIQFLTSIISPLIFIPLAILLGKYFGQAGIIYASILCNFYGIVLAPLQYKKIISNQAQGVWNK